MKNKIPESHHHRSLRLKGNDYSGEGLYFITICTKDRQHYFGKISNGEMIPNETGCIAEKFSEEVSLHFSHGIVAEHSVMPNHVHFITVINRIFRYDCDQSNKKCTDNTQNRNCCHHRRVVPVNCFRILSVQISFNSKR